MADISSVLREFDQRYADRYYGIYKGQVKDIQDPHKLCRLKCTFPQHFGNKDDTLGWAFPSPAIGGGINNSGLVDIPSVDTFVYLQFVDGDINEPVWSYGPWHLLEDSTSSGVPKHAQGLADIEDQGSKGTNNIPKSTFRGQYGLVRLWRTPAGHMIEMDDTPGEERIQIIHKRGTHIEILSDGSVVDCSEGGRVIVTKGDRRERVLGDANTVVTGNKTEEVHGNLKQTIKGDAEFIWLGNQKYKIGKLEWTTDGDQKFTSGGNLLYACNANLKQEVGGSRSSMVTSADSQTVLGPYNLMVANATNTNPLAASMLLHAMNGTQAFRCTDPTGKASGGYIETSFAPALMKLFAGSPVESLTQLPGVGAQTGSGLVLDGSGTGTVLHSMINLILMAKALITVLAPIVQLGMAAVHPVLWGEVAALIFDTHIHLLAGIPTTPPVAPVMTATALSKNVFTT
jgi:hypothetical protein